MPFARAGMRMLPAFDTHQSAQAWETRHELTYVSSDSHYTAMESYESALATCVSTSGQMDVVEIDGTAKDIGVGVGDH